MDVGNACVRMQASQTYHLEQMTRRVLQYIEENTKVLFVVKGVIDILLHCFFEVLFTAEI